MTPVGDDAAVYDGGDDANWIEYSSMDSTRYNTSLTAMALASSMVLHPFNVITTRQQAGTVVTGDPKAVAKHTVAESLLHYRKELGWRGLFRGWLPVATVGSLSQIVYLQITEKTREVFQTRLRGMAPPATPGVVIDTAQSAATAFLANAVSLVPFVPAEVVSSRMIVQPAKGIGMFNMIRLIYSEGRDYGGRSGGVQAFYRGFNISFVYGVVLSTFWWGTYSTSRRYLNSFDALKQHPTALDAAAGLAAGLISTCCAHPLDTVKTRIMTGTTLTYLPILATMRGILVSEGHRALWKGLPAAAVHGALSSTGFALSYEIIKRFSAVSADEHPSATH